MTYYIDLFGCAKNQVDAENMMSSLAESGWMLSDNAENADLVIINSCGFIESAKRESINAVLHWRKTYPEKKILLAGCLAQRYGKELTSDLAEADGIFGVEDIPGISFAAEKTMNGGSNSGSSGNGRIKFPGGKNESGMRPILSMPGSAYVKISEGCANGCSFCAIPLIRGNLRSRSASDIVAECRTLVQRGIKELCLIGQDTGAYGRDLPEFKSDLGQGFESGLPGLFAAISGIEGNFRVRVLYIHPDHFPMPILDIMEEDTRFIPYFDIPFQHASEKILRAMRRLGNAEKYLGLVGAIRNKFRHATIRSTFLTGFPGENEEDFAILEDFQKRAELDWMGCFAFSREENTQAYNLKGRVPKKLALERKRILEEKQIAITENQMERFVGQNFEVLIEEKFDSPDSDERPFLYLGRLPCQAPEVDGSAVITSQSPLKLGSLLPCRVSSRAGFDLKVEIKQDPSDDHCGC